MERSFFLNGGGNIFSPFTFRRLQVIGKAVTINDDASNTVAGNKKVCCVFQNATASAPTTAAPGLSLMAGMASALLASMATGANSA